FVVCDRWHASIPGPTEPNRFFAHAASSAGYDDSPSQTEMIEWETAPGNGLKFKHGTIFAALNHAKVKWRIYAGDDFPFAAALHGISFLHRGASSFGRGDIHEFEDFDRDLRSPKFDAKFVWIEPDYATINRHHNLYVGGNSQHPPSDGAYRDLEYVTRGE